MEDSVYVSFDGLNKPEKRFNTLERTKSLAFTITRILNRFSISTGLWPISRSEDNLLNSVPSPNPFLFHL